MRIPLRTKINLGFCVALALLLAIAALSYQKISALSSNNEWVIHTHQVLEQLQTVAMDLQTIQSQGRGYLLTGDGAFMERYRTAVGDLRSSVNELRDLTRDNPNQQRRLDQIEQPIAVLLATWENDLARRNTASQGFSARIAEVNACSAILQQMTSEERHLLEVRNQELRSSSEATLLSIATSALLALLIIGIATILINRELGQRQRAENRVRQLNESLERRASELKVMNQKLQGFRQLVDQVTDYAILMLDPTGNVVTWNAGAERINGYSADEIIGQHFSKFYVPEDLATGKPEWELQVAATRGSVEDEGSRVRKDGSRFFASVVIGALRDSGGNLLGFSKVSRDITKRIEADEALRKHAVDLAKANSDLAATNHELEAFTYSVSHDLRAPLRQMDGFSRILLEDFCAGLPEQGQHYLKRIREGAVSMGQLIDDLLGFARIGRKELALQPTGLNSIVAGVLEDIKRDTNERLIEWHIGELPFVECDPYLTRHVLFNLLSNAVKYTRPRSPAIIEIGVTRNQEGAIFVKDNGVGFNMKHANKLFGVFQRLHRAEDFEGTGIGLATVQRIIHKHGGRIWAESEIDQGTTFYFTLAPAVTVSAATVQEATTA